MYLVLYVFTWSPMPAALDYAAAIRPGQISECHDVIQNRFFSRLLTKGVGSSLKENLEPWLETLDQ